MTQRPILSQAQLHQAIEEYERQIVIPEGADEKPQFALCVIGLTGAGKTTIIKELCQCIPMVRVSGDDARLVLRDMGLPYDDPNVIISINGELSGRYKQAGYRVAHDNDFSNPTARQAVGAKNRLYGVREIWVRIRPPEDWILARLRTRSDHQVLTSSDDAIAAYFRRRELQTQNSSWINDLPFVYEFDPSKSDLDQQIKAAVEAIRQALGH